MSEYDQLIVDGLGTIAKEIREQTNVLKELVPLLAHPTIVMDFARNWACGCGHINGPALATCALCGRKPGETS